MSSYQPPPPPPPNAQQPPLQMPFSDPFHNRDPFMPATQHRRKDSYGGSVGGPPLTAMAGERAWAGPQGPQTAQSLSHPLHPPHHQPAPYPADPHRPLSHAYDHARRSSVGPGPVPGPGPAPSPSKYGGPLEPPPPPAFAPRNMPPPSPSPAAAPFAAHPSRPPPPASPFGNPRDAPPFAPRSNGMSIGSLIGADRPNQGDRSPKATTTHNSPTLRQNNPPSPKRARSTSMREDYSRPSHPSSPGAYAHASVEHRDERDRWYAPRPFAGGPSGAPAVPAFRPYQSSPTSVAAQQAHANGHGTPARPNSQPSNTVQERVEAWRAAQPEHRVHAGFREYPAHPQERKYRQERDARHAYDPARQAETRPPPTASPYVAHEKDSYPRRPYPSSERRYEYEDRRPGEPGSVPGPVSSPPAPESNAFDSRFRHYGGPPQDRHETSSLPGGRRDDEGHHVARPFLTVSPELNRKGGRSSPLPQAVQGAQPQPRSMGPGRDPSIKNEFGRMFSGLGSGVGGSSTPTGPYSAAGNLTPSRMSPSRLPETDHDHLHEQENLVDGRSVLHGEDRADPARTGLDGTHGRTTPATSVDGSKRIKIGHTPHHHHHHGHVHHHHHHHHAAPEDSASTRTGFSTLRFPATGAPSTSAQPLHHHHHHHVDQTHQTQHQHQRQKNHLAPCPEITTRNKDVFEHARTNPRVHLGSVLYSTSLSLPANKSSLLESSHNRFASTPKPIPYFPDGQNCTFTIRVPRAYIAKSSSPTSPTLAGGLAGICSRRALWGTEIYTDDSDPVAAAVHSGWLKGDFPDFQEDMELVCPSLSPPSGPSDADPTSLDGGSLLKKPARPVLIPSDRDMHITVVILPPLQEYHGSTVNFIKSRSWGGDHDGMSFILQRIDFVDEGKEDRYLERGLASRKRKVREELQRREAAEGLLGLARAVGVGA